MKLNEEFLEAIGHLVQKVLLTCKIKWKITPNRSPKCCGNVLKLDPSE